LPFNVSVPEAQLRRLGSVRRRLRNERGQTEGGEEEGRVDSRDADGEDDECGNDDEGEGKGEDNGFRSACASRVPSLGLQDRQPAPAP